MLWELQDHLHSYTNELQKNLTRGLSEDLPHQWLWFNEAIGGGLSEEMKINVLLHLPEAKTGRHCDKSCTSAYVRWVSRTKEVGTIPKKKVNIETGNLYS